MAQDAAMTSGNGGLLQATAIALREAAAAVMATDDPEAVHRTRVLLRRALSLCWLARPVGDPEQLGVMTEELRWAARSLAQARAIDIALPRIVDASVEAWLGGARQAAYAAARRALAAPRFDALVERLEAVPDGLGPDQAGVSPLLLDRAWRRLRRTARHLDPARPETLHAVRLAAKRLRHGILSCPVDGGKRRRRLLERLEQLQDLTGELCDRWGAVALLEELGLPPQTIARALRTEAEGEAALRGRALVVLARILERRPYWR